MFLFCFDLLTMYSIAVPNVVSISIYVFYMPFAGFVKIVKYDRK